MLDIIIVDDSALMRKTIEDVFATIPGCTVVGKAANGLEALELVRLHLPDLVIMDIAMPVMGGMKALGLLKREKPDIYVVMVSSILDREQCEHALGLGAYACVEKGPGLWERLVTIVTELSGKCPTRA